MVCIIFFFDFVFVFVEISFVVIYHKFLTYIKKCLF